jgi:hypothetical protein
MVSFIIFMIVTMLAGSNQLPLRFQTKQFFLHNNGDTYNNPNIELIVTLNTVNDANGAMGFRLTQGQNTINKGKLEPGDFWDFNYNGSKYRLVYLNLVKDYLTRHDGALAAHFELSYIGKQK